MARGLSGGLPFFRAGAAQPLLQLSTNGRLPQPPQTDSVHSGANKEWRSRTEVGVMYITSYEPINTVMEATLVRNKTPLQLTRRFRDTGLRKLCTSISEKTCRCVKET